MKTALKLDKKLALEIYLTVKNEMKKPNSICTAEFANLKYSLISISLKL